MRSAVLYFTYAQIKKFVRAMGKDVGAMGNDMQALKKHLDDVSCFEHGHQAGAA